MRAFLLTTALLLAARPAAAQPSVVVQPLAGHDTDQFDEFGYSVEVRTDPARSEDTFLIVGARTQSEPYNWGAGYVFRRDPATGAFVEDAKLQQQGPNGYQGEDVALLPPAGTDGYWLALVSGGGAAHLWQHTPSTAPTPAWARVAYFDPPGPQYEYGGRASALLRDGDGTEFVALSDGDSVLVWRRAAGVAGWTFDGGVSPGAAHPFALTSKTMAAWTGSDGAVRVAAPVFSSPRAVAIFARDRSTGQWAEEGRVQASATVAGHEFGYALGGSAAPGGDVVVVGAPYRRPPYDRQGQAYVYRRDATTGMWAEETRLDALVANRSTWGANVAVDGEVAVVNQGYRVLRFYRNEGGVWSDVGVYDYAPDDAVDRANLSFDGRFLLMGDPFDETLGYEAGRAWVLTLPGAFTPAEEAPETAGTALAVAPNPSRASATVRLSLVEASATVTVAAFDVLGRRVAVLHVGPLSAGEHRLGVDVSAWPAGVYVVRAEGVGGALAQTLTVAH